MMAAGVCAYCGVTEEKIDGNKLSWHDNSRICCSKYDCVRKHYAALKAAAEKRRAERDAARAANPYKYWGYGAFVEEKRRLARNAKARAKRKAGNAGGKGTTA